MSSIKVKRTLVCFILSLIIVFNFLPLKAEAISNKDTNIEENYYKIQKDLIMKEVYSQLNTQTLSSSTKTYLPNGGTVYYKDYLGTRTEVTEIYLSKKDSEAYMNGNLKKDILVGLIGYLASSIPKYGYVIGLFLTLNSISLSNTFREARNGTGRLKFFYSDDGDGSASLVLHWWNAPYANVYSGAKVNRK